MRTGCNGTVTAQERQISFTNYNAWVDDNSMYAKANGTCVATDVLSGTVMT